jgi:8-oxo-dGTP pyrophosphatase MutT (NUDIX family)
MKNVCFEDFIHLLKNNLALPLPGRLAQFKLAPPTRNNYPEKIPNDVRLGAVLALFFQQNDANRLIFIQRTQGRGVHSGQISFPGGRQEKTDQTMLNTAIRETFEEIGISPGEINIVGKLSLLYVPPSNFLVHPFVGFVSKPPVFNPDPKEVSEVFSVSVSDLLSASCIRLMEMAVHNFRISVPCFYVDGKIIWGATAMILGELLEVIRS